MAIKVLVFCAPGFFMPLKPLALIILAMATLLTLGWFGWALAQRLVLGPRCPRCGSTSFRRSEPTSWIERVFRRLCPVYRCRSCRARFYLPILDPR